MPGPWEKYQTTPATQEAGPWTKYSRPTLADNPDIDRDTNPPAAAPDILDKPAAPGQPDDGLRASIAANKGMMTTSVSPRNEMAIQAQRMAREKEVNAAGGDPTRDPELQHLNRRYAEAERGRVLETAAIGAIPSEPIAKGAAAAVRAATRPEARALLEAAPKIRLTPGQQFGGAIRTAESSLESLPFGGTALTNARELSVADLNRELYNRALAPVGLKFEGKEIGRVGVKQVGEKLNAEYDKLKPNLTWRAQGPEWIADLTTLTRNVGKLSPELQKQARSIYDNVVVHNMGKGGAMDGETFKKVESELGTLATNYKSSTLASERDLGSRIEEMQGIMRDQLARSNPAVAAELEKLNTSWAIFTRIREAAARRAGGAGEISPNDLSQAVRRGDRSVGKGAFARGDALLQDLSDPAQAVLPSNVAKSGTGERLLHASSLAQAAGALGYLPTKGYLGAGRLLNRAARPGAGEGFPLVPVPLPVAPDYRSTAQDALDNRTPADAALNR